MTIADAVIDMMNETKEATSNLRTFTPADLETLYSSAYHLYNQGSYVKASDLFMQLTLSNPYEETYWRGLASTYQMQSLWNEALHAWSLCAILKENDPLPHYHAAECLYSQQEIEDALKALSLARLHCKEDDESTLLPKIQLLQELCSR